MSLDVYLYFTVDTGKSKESIDVFWSNITHNLTTMAYKAGIYCHCWRPEEIGIKTAGDLIEPLRNGLSRLKKYPKYFDQFSAANGWGLYEHFVPWVEEYLNACEEYPKAEIAISR
jgi:hypothetical protein